jgi:hypothetical protein
LRIPRPSARQLREWLRRYLPAELSGTVTALLAAQAAFVASHSLLIAAFAGTIGETIGYYAAITIREVAAHYRLHQHQTGRRRLGLTCVSCLRSLIIEFGLAEAIDSAFVRPYFLWASPQLIGQVQLGWLVAKLAADVVFYAIAITGYEFHKRRFMRPASELLTARSAARSTGCGRRL